MVAGRTWRLQSPVRKSLHIAITAISGWPNSMFKAKKLFLKNYPDPLPYVPYIPSQLMAISHRLRDEPCWKGLLIISRKLLLHFMEEGHDCPDEKVICLSSWSKLVPELGLEPRHPDSSSSALPLYQVVCMFKVFKCELTWRGRDC